MYPIVRPSRPTIKPDTNPTVSPVVPPYSHTRRSQTRHLAAATTATATSTLHQEPSIKITNYTSRNLFFEERNACASETVVLIHELYACHLQFKWVRLTGSGGANPAVGGGGGGGFGFTDDKDTWGLGVGNGYHVLIPDLPGHSLSRDLLWSHPADFGGHSSDAGQGTQTASAATTPTGGSGNSSNTTNAAPSLLRITCGHLYDLIHQHAKQQRAHLVGVGYGAYIALQMAKMFPSIVSCVIAMTPPSSALGSIASISPTSLKRNLTFFTPYLSYASLKPILTIPKLYEWMTEEGRAGSGGGSANDGEKSTGRMGREKLHKGVKLPEGLTEEMWTNTKLELAKKVYHSLRTEFDLDSVIRTITSRKNAGYGGVAGWEGRGYWRTNANSDGEVMNLDWYGSRKRTLLVIDNDGEWAGLAKTQGLGTVLAGEGKDVESKKEGRFMVATRGMAHAWNLHEPEVFARLVEGWIQGGENGLPPELVGWKTWVGDQT